MANHPSALKRARQNEIRRLRNKSTRTRVRNATKMLRQSVAEGAGENVQNQLNTAKSVIAKASKTGVIHKRTAARKISRLSRLVNTLAA